MTPFLPVRHAAVTDVGVKRSHNQDAWAAHPAGDPDAWAEYGHVFVVADGMGGHAVGEKASAKAVRDIPLVYHKHAADGPADAIRRAFVEANKAIHAIGQSNPEFKGLGTTGTALFVRPDGAWVGHVGDSRAYRIRAGRVHQLTFDHSWVWEVARRQGVDPDELGDFKKNVIIRSLGPDADVEVDVEGPHPLLPGDTFLLCSDGLSNLVAPDELGAAATAFDPDQACRFLIELANLRGGPDNITCLIVRTHADPTGPVSRLSRRLGPRLPPWAKRAVQPLRAVPWPQAALAAVLPAVVLAFVAKEVAGQWAAGLPFLAALGLLVAGVAGLVRQARRPPAADAPADGGPLHLYRDHPFAVDDRMVGRLAELEAGLKTALDGKAADLGIDLDAHARLAAEADALAGRGAWGEAFAARCRSLLALAGPFNKQRHKPESFEPHFVKG